MTSMNVDLCVEKGPPYQDSQRTTTDSGDDELQTLMRDFYDKNHDEIKASAMDDDDDYTALLSTFEPRTLITQNPMGMVLIDRNGPDTSHLAFTKHDLPPPPPCQVPLPKRKQDSPTVLAKAPSKKPRIPGFGNPLEAQDKNIVSTSPT
ncbi:hypothetical protein [Absidia glauca]|uniref:Uncharacterized protein n=1 Tax=Absidia glauca TaxID=4829 RepID=A0A163KL40_ABSGL|nr:hypothetical protein [Absidia glauca]